MRRFSLSLVVPGLVLGFGGVVEVQAEPVWWSGGGHWYEVVYVEGGVSWTDARDAAAGTGGHLATITSEEENEFVFSLAIADSRVWHTDISGNTEGPWLGGYQPEGSPEPDGGWRWVTTEPFDYTCWGVGQPTNSLEGQGFLCFYGMGLNNPTKYWNDFGTPTTGYVLEIIPEPSTIALLCAGVVGVAGYACRKVRCRGRACRSIRARM